MVGFVEMGVGLTGWRISANSGQSEVPAAIALRCEALKIAEVNRIPAKVLRDRARRLLRAAERAGCECVKIEV